MKNAREHAKRARELAKKQQKPNAYKPFMVGYQKKAGAKPSSDLFATLDEAKKRAEQLMGRGIPAIVYEENDEGGYDPI